MRFNNLNDWLTWQETLNPAEIELGLDRVSAVLKQTGLPNTFDCPLITVAGTNGKGSVVAILEAIAMAAGLNVCSYTSPHLFQYSERIKINGTAVDDDQLCEAFERIDTARNELSDEGGQLTYFEFGALAAIDLFSRQPSENQPDLVILEIGLGGRLDAVNIMDADVAVLTSVAIDHVDWLGDDRESIGFEKAGIFRAKQTVICGEHNPPASVVEHAKKLQCEFIQIEQHYSVIKSDPTNLGVINPGAINSGSSSDEVNDSWLLKSDYGDFTELPQPSLIGDFQKANAATAVMALQALNKKGLLFKGAGLSLSETEGAGLQSAGLLNIGTLHQAVKTGLKNIHLSGRFQQINTCPLVYVDVAHNPQAALALASQLKLNIAQRLLPRKQTPKKRGKTWAIVAMLSDKDVEGVISNVDDCIDSWCVAGLEGVARGLSASALAERLSLVLADLSTEDKFTEVEPTNAKLTEPGSAKISSELASEVRENQCKMPSEGGSTVVLVADTVGNACELVLSKADKEDRVIIFGSFYTVSEAMQFFQIK